MATGKITKGKRFRLLIARSDDALQNKYYMEALGITYALFEERTRRILDKLGIHYNTEDRLFTCLNKLKKAITTRNISTATKKLTLNAFIDLLDEMLIKSGLISRIQSWRQSRNTAIHELVKSEIDYDELKDPAVEGNKLFREFTDFITRIDKVIL